MEYVAARERLRVQWCQWIIMYKCHWFMWRVQVCWMISAHSGKKGRENSCVCKLDTFTIFWQWIKYYAFLYWIWIQIEMCREWIPPLNIHYYTRCVPFMIWFCVSFQLVYFHINSSSCRAKWKWIYLSRTVAAAVAAFFPNQSRTFLHLFQFYSISLYCI